MSLPSKRLSTSQCLHRPKLFLIIGLLLFTKLLELLAINHSLPESRIICSSVVEVLPCSGAHFSAGELDNVIWFSTLSRMSGFLWHSSKWACYFSCLLQYMSRLEVLACSLNTDLNYVIAILQLHPSLNH